MKYTPATKVIILNVIMALLFISLTSSAQCDLEDMRRAAHKTMVKEGGWKYAGYWDFTANQYRTTMEEIPVKSDVIMQVSITACADCEPVFGVKRYKNYNDIASNTDAKTTRKSLGKSHVVISKMIPMKAGEKIFVRYGASDKCKNWRGGEYNLLIFYKKI